MENIPEAPANPTANKARAWLFLCAILRIYQKYGDEETFIKGLDAMRAVFDNIENFDIFSARRINATVPGSDIYNEILCFRLIDTIKQDNSNRFQAGSEAENARVKLSDLIRDLHKTIIPDNDRTGVGYQELVHRLQNLAKFSDQSLADIEAAGDNYGFYTRT